MEIDYKEIGRRIARRRKELKLTQLEVEEQADLGQKYLSNIERSISIPSIEVIMRLAAALDTTPDEFLVGTLHEDTKDEWENISELLRNMSPAQLSMAKSFLTWLSEPPVTVKEPTYLSPWSKEAGENRLDFLLLLNNICKKTTYSSFLSSTILI